MTQELATQDTQELAHSDNVDLNIPQGYICTVDTSTREGTIKVANALSDAQSLTEKGNERFTLVDVVTTPGVRTRTGEACVNVYLITADGSIYMSQSEGIKRSVIQMVGLFNGDLGSGVDVQVVEKTLANGNTLKTLHFYE